MKKLFLTILVLSFVVVGVAFANDEDTPKIRATDQFTQYQDDDREPSIKALIGSEQLPIVDQADIRDPNFVGERPSVEHLQQSRSVGVTAPTSAGQPSLPSSPVQP